MAVGDRPVSVDDRALGDDRVLLVHSLQLAQSHAYRLRRTGELRFSIGGPGAVDLAVEYPGVSRLHSDHHRGAGDLVRGALQRGVSRHKALEQDSTTPITPSSTS